jgi:hypothetical protein
MWNFMQGKLKEKDSIYMPKLIKEIELLWTTGIAKDYREIQSNSMTRRIQKVIAAKGEATKH